MKFDAIIMNPPYNTGNNIRLSDNILVELTINKIANHIVTIQPMNALFTTYTPGNLQIKLKEHLKYLKAIDGGKVWNNKPCFMYPLFISHLTTFNKYEEVLYENNVCNFFNIPAKKYKSLIQEMIPSHSIQTSIINKTLELCKTNGNLHLLKGKINNFYCNYNARIGNISNKHNLFYSSSMFNLVNNVGYDKNISNIPRTTPGKSTFYLGFETLYEAKNCYDFIKSTFIKLINTKYKTSPKVPNLYHIPLLDFTTPVTDERIQKEFGLTNQEMEFINDFGNQLDGTSVDSSKYD